MPLRQKLFKELSGLVALWKPVGVTSAQYCYAFRDMLCSEANYQTQVHHRFRVGHGGTLDKEAEGVLAVGIEDGCSMLKHLLNGEKVYEAGGCLGVATDTFNENGSMTARKTFAHVTSEKFEKTLERFHGKIKQVPPKYSALKYKGERLSDLERNGYEIPDEKMVPRKVYVRSIICTSFQPPDFNLEIHSGGGFYVRSLIHDLGLALDSCAHMTTLVRTKHGQFVSEDTLPESHWTLSEVIDHIRRNKEHIQRSIHYHKDD